MDGNKINLLKSYFTAFQLNNEFYSYADLARYLGISTAIVKNVYTDRTVFPSKKLTKHLSERFNMKPEVILNDIYSESFVIPCNEHTKIVTLSLYYNFGYTIVIDEHNFIEDGKLKSPSNNHFIPYFAKMRITGPELKYTLVLDWNNLREVLCGRTQNLLIKNDYILMAVSNLYYTICTDESDDIKRLIVVFASDEEEDYQLFRKMCNDSKHRVLPLLYDENAEYSIRDVDMLNGIR